MPLVPLRIRALAGALLLLGGLTAAAGGAGGERPAAPATGRRVASCVLTDTVDAGSAAYLVDCVKTAETGNYDALLVRVDTPGGALESTREIARSFLGSNVPILVWVGPSGARAGSAGVFITLAAHVAGMAPGTNIGAAHPVMGPGGQDPEQGGEHMAEKVVNDTAAFAEAIARQRGRNVEWAVKAVRESASIAAPQAVEMNVVDLLASTERGLLEAASGKVVDLPDGKRTLDIADASIEPFQPSPRQRLVHWLANPAVAYLLFLVGGLGLAIEFSNPGAIVPGLVGGVCLILALIAFSALPIQAGAIALLLIGLGLIAAELFVTSGLLGAGGVVLLILGGVLLVDRFDAEWFVEPSFALSLRLLIPTAVLFGGGAVYLAIRSAQTRRLPQQAGDLGLLSETGRALSEIGPDGGEVFIHGERWRAVSAAPIAPGKPVVVRKAEGLTLHVEEART